VGARATTIEHLSLIVLLLLDPLWQRDELLSYRQLRTPPPRCRRCICSALPAREDATCRFDESNRFAPRARCNEGKLRW
jgi:hypothetical protein